MKRASIPRMLSCYVHFCLPGMHNHAATQRHGRHASR
jgi:hypothetical protein